MKYILIICCLLVTINSSCQVTQTVPLQEIDYPNGAYRKDMLNQFSFFVGSWKGTVNQIEYTFELSFFPQVLKTYENDMYEYKDQLMGKFKAVNLTNNQVLYDNLNAIDIEDYKLLALNISESKVFNFRFLDTESNCFNRVNFKLIKNDTNPNQITYKGIELGEFGLFYDGAYGCPYYEQQSDIPMFLPTEELILTRQ